MGGGINVTQVPATVIVVTVVPDDGFVVAPIDGVGVGTEAGAPGLAPEVGLPLASGAGITPGAVAQVVTIVVAVTGFGVGLMLPIAAAVPPVESAGLADGAAELGLVVGAWLGLVGVVRLGGVMLLWLGVKGVGDGACPAVGVVAGVCARITPAAAKTSVIFQSRLIRTGSP